MFAEQDDPERGRLLADLPGYMTGPGQASADRLHDTPIPRDLRESVASKLRLIHAPDGSQLAP